jgi:NAD(P)-dependent dehydrogenase (short-subunit alcohol dehydrogenase family)
MYTAKLALHYFYKQRDDQKRDRCLILKSSLAGYIDLVGIPLYQAAKYGVRGLMHNLRRLDYLRVNLIAPWYIAGNPGSITRGVSANHAQVYYHAHIE